MWVDRQVHKRGVFDVAARNILKEYWRYGQSPWYLDAGRGWSPKYHQIKVIKVLLENSRAGCRLADREGGREGGIRGGASCVLKGI